ncbi:MAG: hypothetical protein JRI47_09860, partial [Deltaproteobacteria bacterium]|nr:hypothetical protein [Deltaproteobacteria bacterium]
MSKKEGRVQLPNADQVIVEPAKIRAYLLSSSHPVGRFKANFFRALGYTDSNWQRFERDVRLIARSGEATRGRDNGYGQTYVVSGTLEGPSGMQAPVATVWIVLA